MLFISLKRSTAVILINNRVHPLVIKFSESGEYCLGYNIDINLSQQPVINVYMVLK